MTSPEEPVPETTREAAEALGLLGHEIRMAIVEALADARRVGWQPRGLTFAELRRAAGVADAGKFNYHLDALLGTFVYKEEDEYVLTNAGLEIEGTIRADPLEDTVDSRSGPVGRSCPTSGEPIQAVYDEDRTLRVFCPVHGTFFVSDLPPTAVRDRDWQSVVRLGLTYAGWQVRKARNGGCPHCWGRVSASAPVDDASDAAWSGEPDPSESAAETVLASFECEDCGLVFWLPVAACVATHPAVVAYYWEHDVDPTDRWIVGLDLVTGANGTVVGEDPTRIEVVVSTTEADDGLVLTLDGETNVVSVAREPDVAVPRPSDG